MVITIAGGGSTFTAGIVKSIALRREELEVDEIRLFDINKERQDKVAVVVDWVLHKELNTDIKLVVTTDVQQAYTDTSFVFAQMRVGGYAMREHTPPTCGWLFSPSASVPHSLVRILVLVAINFGSC